MDIEKSVSITKFKLFGKVILEINKTVEVNFKENVEPIYPPTEINWDNLSTDN